LKYKASENQTSIVQIDKVS